MLIEKLYQSIIGLNKSNFSFCSDDDLTANLSDSIITLYNDNITYTFYQSHENSNNITVFGDDGTLAMELFEIKRIFRRNDRIELATNTGNVELF